MFDSFPLMVLFCTLLSYLLGSIPFSQMVAHWRAGVDLRKEGYRNVGAYNVLHTVGVQWGLLAGFLDAVKGMLAVVLVTALGLTAPFDKLTVLGAILGHNYPFWLNFRGGKGVMIAVGMLFWVAPFETMLAVAGALLVFRIVHLVNVSVTCGFILIVTSSFIFQRYKDIEILVFGSIFIIGLAYLPRFVQWLISHGLSQTLSRKRE